MERGKLLEFARLGAARRVEQIDRELAEARAIIAQLSASGPRGELLLRGRAMTPEQRAEVSRRMRAYWASRRAASRRSAGA